MSKTQILVADETPELLKSTVHALKEENYHVFSASTESAATSLLMMHPSIHVVILSSAITDTLPLAFLEKLEQSIGLPYVIILGKDLAAQDAVDLMKAGASDIVKCPFHPLELTIAVRQSCEVQNMMEYLNRQKDRDFDQAVLKNLQTLETDLKDKHRDGQVMSPSEISAHFSTDATFHSKPVILTVDDEINVVDGLELDLSFEYDVLRAHSGEDAYEILKAKSPRVDMVLLDIGMPIVSGDKWVSRFKDIDPDLIIMMLTAYGEDIDLIVNTIRAGAQDYISKPYLSHLLLDKVSLALQKKVLSENVAKLTGTSHFRLTGVTEFVERKRLELEAEEEANNAKGSEP